MSQKTFISRLRRVSLGDVVFQGKVRLSKVQLRKFYRSHLRAFIWINQGRYDVAFLITSFSTSAAYSISSIEDITAMVRLINQIIRGLHHREAYTSFGFLSDSGHGGIGF